MTKNQFNRVKGSAKIDLRNWENMQSVEKLKATLEKTVMEAATEALTVAFKESAFFCFASDNRKGRDGSHDPMTLCFILGLGRDTNNDPEWTVSLADIVKQEIEDETVAGKFGNKSAPRMMKIRDGLRELADQIDTVLGKGIVL